MNENEKKKPGPKSDSIRKANIIALRQQGLTLQKVADLYDVSRQRIHQILNS